MSPLASHGRPQTIKALIEDMFLAVGIFPNIQWKKVYEGYERGHEQSNEPNRFYTKVYRFWLDGKPTRIRARFRYDKRKNWADVSMSLDGVKELEEIMDRLKEKSKDEKEEEVIEL